MVIEITLETQINGFNENMKEFVKNVIYPLKVTDIKEEEGVITLTPMDHQTRGMLIGRSAQNLRGFEDIVKRYFEITEMKVT